MQKRIPAELRALPQWCAARADGAPVDPKTGMLAAVDKPGTWGTYEQAVAFGSDHVGLVLTAHDPFVVIDLDDKEYSPAPPEEKAVHEKIVQAFQSYAERSKSKRGYHVVIRGKMPVGGKRRGRTEVYSAGRFMILTGDRVNDLPIADRQELLDLLLKEMPDTVTTDLGADAEEVLTDAELFDMAMNADNGAKFDALTRGDMTGYPSQSEADLALLSILAFYSRSNAQVRRIFRASPLGKREKAQRDDRYIDYALRKIRGKEAPPVDLTQVMTMASAQIQPKAGPTTAPQAPKASETFKEPPGFLGELVRYFLSTTIRPVPEISLAAAIGVLAGVSGRAYNVSGAGLNQYLLLLAKTGTGKEGMQSAIDSLLTAIRQTVPVVDDFLGPAAFASGQALVKTLAKKPCVVSILGEFGLTLQHLSDPRNATSVMFKKVLLDIYGKSGANQTLRSSVYSDSDKSTGNIHSPSLTILGESTPETFFDGLSSVHVAEGLIPRFLIIHYAGPRPPINKTPNQPVPEPILRRMIELVTASMTMQNQFQTMNVQTSPEAARIFDALNIEADHAINSAKMDTEAQLWNRAHLKALKLAAVLAVADNPHAPTINEEQAIWASALVRKDLTTMISKFTAGDIGHGDAKQMSDIRRALDHYFVADEQTLVKSYAIPPGTRSKGLIPYVYLQRRTSALTSFRNDRLGATTALKRCVEELVSAGELLELPKSQGATIGFTGRVFCRPLPKD